MMGRPPLPRPLVIQPSDESIRLIALTRYKTAIVDAEDYDRIMQSSWCAWWSGNAWYAQARRNQKIIYMHREVLQVSDDTQVDHRRRKDTLDNRKSNLRLATVSEQMCNTSLRKDNVSGFRGICWYKSKGMWLAFINKEGKRYSHWFKEKDDAINWRTQAAIDLHGEFASLPYEVTI
jgi:hypothetical protein